MRVAAVVAAAFLIGTRIAGAAVYTDPATFLSALARRPGIQVSQFPSSAVTFEDAFGARTSEFDGVPAVTRPGELSGAFYCNPNITPCAGVYRLTYTLPFTIAGYAGTLQYGDQATYPRGGAVFSVSPSMITTGFTYQGFFGELFVAPTNVITLTWVPGLQSCDCFAEFGLTSATVIVDLPEPASVLLLAIGGFSAAGLGALTRRSPRPLRSGHAPT